MAYMRGPGVYVCETLGLVLGSEDTQRVEINSWKHQTLQGTRESLGEALECVQV